MNEINLDDTILVSCPERGFKLRMVKHCIGCDFYKGLVHANDSEGNKLDGDVQNTHHVLCSRPYTRSLIKMSDD